MSHKTCRTLFLFTTILMLISNCCGCDLSDFQFDLEHVDHDQRDQLFAYLDKDGDKALNEREIRTLFPILFYSTKQNRSLTDEIKDDKLVEALDVKADKPIDKLRFDFIWDNWIKIILKPKAALIVVDVQNDFIADNGSMPLTGAQTTVQVINELIKNVNFETVVYTYDWHPSNHCSFIDNIHLRNYTNLEAIKTIEELVVGDYIHFTQSNQTQRLWRRHCVQGSVGSQLYDQLIVANNSFNVTKGTDPEIDSYSAFEDNGGLKTTDLHQNLIDRGITDVYLSGVVYEYCVGYTALHALKRGYRTAFVENAIHEITQKEQAQMRTNLMEKSANLIQSEDVFDMVNGRERTVEMGLVLAQKVFKKH